MRLALLAIVTVLASTAGADPGALAFRELKFTSQTPQTYKMGVFQPPLRALDLKSCGTYTAMFISVELSIIPSGAISNVKLQPHNKGAPIDETLRSCASDLFKTVTLPPRKSGSTLRFLMMYRS